jgi:hypothetical protein
MATLENFGQFFPELSGHNDRVAMVILFFIFV